MGLSGHPDENVIAYAYREDRVLLTHDPDFLDDRKFPPHRNPGVIILPQAATGRRALAIAVDDVVRIVGPSRHNWRSTKIVVARDRTWTVHTFERDVGQIITSRYRMRGRVAEVWIDES